MKAKTKSKKKPSQKKLKNKFTEELSKKHASLNEKSFLNIHWDLAHALLNSAVSPQVANAFAAQTSRILGFKKLEIERAKMVGERAGKSLLPSGDKK